jgi:putative transposase
MILKRAHKIRLRPTREQAQYLFKACAACRHAYNWGLEQYNLIYDENDQAYKNGQGEKKSYPSARNILKKEYLKIRPDWTKEVTAFAVQGAFDDLGKSLKRFWDIQTGKITIPKPKKPRGDNKRQGWPHWRARYGKYSYYGFYLANIQIRLDGKYVQFDKKRVGWMRMEESLRYPDSKIMGGRVTWDGKYWWLSLQVEFEIDKPEPLDNAIGIDLGIKYLATTSEGQIFENPKAAYQHDAKIRRLKRHLDRQRRANNPGNYNENGTVKEGRLEWIKSNRMIQTERQIARLETKARNIRNNAQHQMTSEITNENGFIGLESLNVRGMMSNHKLARSVADSSFFEIGRQLEYKAEAQGGIVQKIDGWFPSSKKCSNCGFINTELTLTTRKWICPECEQTNERDLNAAINILDEALKIYNGPQVRG